MALTSGINKARAGFSIETPNKAGGKTTGDLSPCIKQTVNLLTVDGHFRCTSGTDQPRRKPKGVLSFSAF